MRPQAIQKWHELAEARDPRRLDALLADEVVFESPVVHTPQVGKAITMKYLGAAFDVLNNDTFRYLNEWHNAQSCVLEFATAIEGVEVNGADFIFWNDKGLITRFKVMVRPLKAINMLHQMMGARLMAGAKA